jgi:hypothetical protein
MPAFSFGVFEKTVEIITRDYYPPLSRWLATDSPYSCDLGVEGAGFKPKGGSIFSIIYTTLRIVLVATAVSEMARMSS